MKPILGILWCLSPIALYNFPAEVWSNGLPHWPAREEFIPREPGNWNHYAKNALHTVVRTDSGFWSQFIIFFFWVLMLGLWIF